MRSLIRLLEKLVFLAAAVVIIVLAHISRSYADPVAQAGNESLASQSVAAESIQRL